MGRVVGNEVIKEEGVGGWVGGEVEAEAECEARTQKCAPKGITKRRRKDSE